MLTKKYQAVRERSRILEDVLMQNKYAVYEEALAEELIPAMGELRAVADASETQTAAKYWPFPTYGELLFSVK